MAINLRANSLVSINGNFLSEHGRQPGKISFDQIETTSRTVDGTLRGYTIAKKKLLDLSWEKLPTQAVYTLDGNLGASDLQDLYLSGGQYQSLAIQVWVDQKVDKTNVSVLPEFSYTGRIKSFDYEVVMRNVQGKFYDFWNVSMSIEEF